MIYTHVIQLDYSDTVRSNRDNRNSSVDPKELHLLQGFDYRVTCVHVFHWGSDAGSGSLLTMYSRNHTHIPL